MKTILLRLFTVFSAFAFSQSNIDLYNNCAGGRSIAFLDINNVRTPLKTSGQYWGDYNTGIFYEIPKGSGKFSMFNGAIWLGATDEYDNIKVAAQTFRQKGDDFWPGPLDTDSTISHSTCAAYDQHYSVLRSQVLAHKLAYENDELDNYHIPASILNWPGNYYNEPTKPLAPFEDLNNNNVYEPELGEYPAFDFDKTKDCRTDNILMGDQSIWWVMNDVGNIHAQSGSETALGIEIHIQAFAIRSNDALDNTSFYQHKIINKSNQVLLDMYFGNFVDADLGDYQDDYVGCHVTQGLGYTYNGDEFDGTEVGYGEHPPAIGVDYLQGPIAPLNDGIDNNYNGEVDEENEDLRMSVFKYFYNITNIPIGNPDNAIDYYNYLKGLWLDGSPQTHGIHWSSSAENPTNYMYPGTTNPAYPNQNWTEQTEGNVPSDRRHAMSTGPFTLEPGQITTITTAVVWSQDLTESVNPHLASLEKLLVDDEFVQTAFDACFELDCSKPRFELFSYELIDIERNACNTKAVQFYYPEETAIYQTNSILWHFGDGNTSTEFNPYYEFEEAGTYEVLVYIENDCGSDYGTFKVDIPCRLADDINSVKITRIQGIGNGNRMVELSDESIDKLLEFYTQDTLSYKVGRGPFQVHINNPLIAEQGNYQLLCINELNSESSWILKNLITNDSLEFTSYRDEVQNKIETPWGFDVQVQQMEDSGNGTNKNGAIGINTIGPYDNWLDFIKDNDEFSSFDQVNFNHPQNWIRSGRDDVDYENLDNDEYFETEYDGEWSPYILVGSERYQNSFKHAPAWEKFQALSSLNSLNNVDIVFTNDKSKWTRVPVIETGNTNEDERLNLKNLPSVGKDGLPDGTGNGFGWFPGYALDVIQGKRLNIMFGEASEFTDDNGNDMLWNPTARVDSGYMYAELSDDPTDEYKVIFGGRHYIYITKTQYMGEDETLHPQYSQLTSMSSITSKRKIFSEISWVSIPLGVYNRTLLSEDVTIQLRVNQAFQESESYTTGETGLPIYQFSIDRNDYYNPIAENEFLLFPNPSTENIFLILDNDSISSIYTQVYASDGKLVLESNPQENAPLQMNVSTLLPGIYHCVLYGDGKRMSGQSFVKQ